MAFRIQSKRSGYMWLESHGSLFEESNGKKFVILLGRGRPTPYLSRHNTEYHGGFGDSDLWAKLSTSGAFLYVSSNARSLLRRNPDTLVATSIQDLMQKDSRPAFDRALDSARRRRITPIKHGLLCQRGYIKAETILYPGDAAKDQQPSFLLAQIKLDKSLSQAPAPAPSRARFGTHQPSASSANRDWVGQTTGEPHDVRTLNDDMFDELSTTRCSSWQFQLRWMERRNQSLAEELAGLLSRKKKRRRRRGAAGDVGDCANCHTRSTPEWWRGPSGQRDLCNRYGLQWAKQVCSLLRILLWQWNAELIFPYRRDAFYHADQYAAPIAGASRPRRCLSRRLRCTRKTLETVSTRMAAM